MQAKLLRVLQDRMVVPVGGRPVPVDVRILAATHRDATHYGRQGKVPRGPVLPHRRGAGSPAAAARAAGRHPPARRALPGRPPAARRRLSAEAAARLLAHPWPGNVRELRNAIERAAVLAPLAVLSAGDFAFLAGEAAGRGDWLAGDLPARSPGWKPK